MSVTEESGSGNKLIIKQLPFETTQEELCDFLEVDDNEVEVNLVTWNNSERCKGHAIITCSTLEEVERIKAKSGLPIVASGNERNVVVEDYEERVVNRRGPNKGPNRRKRNDQREENSFAPDDESQREVYVSNLSFQATETDFRDVFGQYGEIEQVTIPKIYSSGRPKGFAFVRFATPEQRDEAIANLNGFTFVGREIGVRENKGRATPQNRQRAPQREKRKLSQRVEGCTTVYVGNLPWKADENELETIFGQFGVVKSGGARVVRKNWTNKSRGFGYVEFETMDAADKAVAAARDAVDNPEAEEGAFVYSLSTQRKLRVDYAEPKIEGKNDGTNDGTTGDILEN